MALLQLKVSSKASRNGIAGWMGETLKLSVTAVPERGRANEAVIELLVEVLDLPKSRIRVVHGQGQSQKLVEVQGLEAVELRRRLQRPGGAGRGCPAAGAARARPRGEPGCRIR